MKLKKKIKYVRSNRINNEIRAQNVRLIGINGNLIGIVSLRKALYEAEKCGHDLVEISTNSDPIVCRIMNYGKFLYEKSKSNKIQNKKQKRIQIKEIKLRPVTFEGDYQVKLNRLKKFLLLGNKVKVTIRFRGREMAHKEIGINMLLRVKKDLSSLSTVDFFPKRIEGRQMIMLLSSKRKKNI
ncbi:translation initiation factor IF-3 [Buchnera aphidicola (Ceratoglyphina bambusae)]|uniref:translation initiation factor IF-3 n=1 Tax=Buchnera aphidicola TaxID=9 RepID=UPI0031B7F99A